MDSNQFYTVVTNLCAVVSVVVPAIWYLASQIQKLNGIIETSHASTREKLKNLENRVVELAEEIKELRLIERSFRERLVAIETKVGRQEL